MISLFSISFPKENTDVKITTMRLYNMLCLFVRRGLTAFLCFFFFITFGQANPTVKVYVMVYSVSWNGYIGDEYGPRFRVFRDAYNDNSCDARLRLDCRSCLEAQRARTGHIVYEKVYNTTQQVATPLKLIFVSHEERKRGSDNCRAEDTGNVTFNEPDRYEDAYELTIKLSDYAPGKYHNFTFTNNYGNIAEVTWHTRIAYEPVIPAQIVSNLTGQICADAPIELKTSITAHATDDLKYEWSYSTGPKSNPAYQECMNNCTEDCRQCWVNRQPECETRCDCSSNCSAVFPTIEDWIPLGTTTIPQLSIEDPADVLFSNRIRESTSLNFRVRAIGADAVSRYSDGRILTFIPQAPSFEISDEMSCPNKPSGKITFNNISGVGSPYTYRIKEGTYTQDCNPEDRNTICNNGLLETGTITGTTFISGAVLQGNKTYTVWLSNGGGTRGVCSSKREITVASHPVLAGASSIANDARCHGLSDASILTGSTGGSPSILFTLENLDNASVINIQRNANDTATFHGLPAAQYSLQIKDQCDQLVTQTITIKQPAKITGTVLASAASCSLPGNGAVEVSIQFSNHQLDIPPSGRFLYSIAHTSGLVKSEVIQGIQWEAGSLRPGDYTLQITDESGSVCNGFNTPFTITGPPPLDVAARLDIGSVPCYGDRKGRIILDGSGGMDSYSYALRHVNTDSLITSPTGTFDNLRAGSYVAIVRSGLPDCLDQFENPAPLIITEPPKIVVQTTAKDISCFSAHDGEINAAVTGGTPASNTYNYTWEKNINGLWASLPQTTPRLDHLQEGLYRLVVADANACKAISPAHQVKEPPQLQINSVVVKDIKCAAERGYIEVTSTGGTAPVYPEFKVNDDGFTRFDASTPLAAGSYQVRIKDANNCTALHTSVVPITEPTAPLTFNYTSSNYNGFNISCYGGANGYVDITASGGNGASYQGYMYAANDLPFQSTPRIENLSAGMHRLQVKDARGCIVHKQVEFTQSEEQITTVITEKHDVVCFGDETGRLAVSGSGGLPPYVFELSNGERNDVGIFEHLPADEYLLTLTDVNGCAQSTAASIQSLHPRIEAAATIIPVNCNGGNDGSINIVTTGGVNPLSHMWSNGQTTQSVTNLSSGTYTLTITDHAGCSRRWEYEVMQPAHSLSLDANPTPACYGQTNGSVALAASGGTFPYSFSADTQTWTPSDIINDLPPGEYTFHVRDQNGCTHSVRSNITQRTDKPEANFLAATKRYAQDTIVIVDISVPKPDSTHWTFDEQIEVVNENETSPEIVCSEQGTYIIIMRAFFSGCSYEIEKQLTLSPYDPLILEERQPNYRSIIHFIASPNPSRGEVSVTVSLSRPRKLSLTLTDMLGDSKLVQSFDGAHEIQHLLDLSSLPSGVYVLRAITESDARELRIVLSE